MCLMEVLRLGYCFSTSVQVVKLSVCQLFSKTRISALSQFLHCVHSYYYCDLYVPDPRCYWNSSLELVSLVLFWRALEKHFFSLKSCFYLLEIPLGKSRSHCSYCCAVPCCLPKRGKKKPSVSLCTAQETVR